MIPLDIVLVVSFFLLIVISFYFAWKALKPRECMDCGYRISSENFWKRRDSYGDIMYQCPNCGSKNIYELEEAKDLKLKILWEDRIKEEEN